MVNRERIHRAQEELSRQGIDYLLLSPGANLYYFTGISSHISSRMFLLAVPKSGEPVIIAPLLESELAHEASQLNVLPWRDGETALPVLKSFFSKGATAVAVDDQMWAGHMIDLQSLLPQAEWRKGSSVMKKLRARKSKEEITILKEAAAIADKTLAELVGQRFSGRTERDIANEIQRLLLKNGQEVMQFCIVGSGPNGAKPHHTSSDKVIEKGDAVILDFGGTYNGYQSDMTRMAVVKGGSLDKDFEKVYNIVNDARRAAHQAAKPGVLCEDVDRAARNVIEQAGYGEFFIHRTGHGLGLDLHEDPYIIPGNQEELETGNAFSIEPGIYLSGRFGVRIEDIAVITESGEENINLSPHEIFWVD